jgi:hypothetical protein
LPLSVLSVEFLPGGVGEDLPIPVVTKIDPNIGPAVGGTRVIIIGKGFASVTSVAFGGAAATNVVPGAHNPDTQLTADTPAGNGTVDVTVTNPGGTSAPSSADRFTYFPSLLSRLSTATARV